MTLASRSAHKNKVTDGFHKTLLLLISVERLPVPAKLSYHNARFFARRGEECPLEIHFSCIFSKEGI